MQQFERALEHYRAGEFDEAIRLLKALQDARPEPALLYNLARAHEGNGDLQDAIDAYRAYLDAEPDAKDAPVIKTRIERLVDQVEREGHGATSPTGCPGTAHRDHDCG